MPFISKAVVVGLVWIVLVIQHVTYMVLLLLVFLSWPLLTVLGKQITVLIQYGYM